MPFKYYCQNILEFLNTNLGKQVKSYFFIYVILWLLHLIFISLISYFHLLLGHNIRTIGDWISDRGWVLIILSKGLIFLGVLQFIKLKNKNLVLLKSYFRNGVQIPRQEIVTLYLFLLIGVIGLGAVDVNSSVVIEIFRTILSIVGTIFFYAIDYIIVMLLELTYPVNGKKEKYQRIFLMPLLFFLFTRFTFIYEQIISFKLYTLFLLLMYLGEWRRRNWLLPMLLLIFFIVPIYSFMGLDPVWNSSYSIFYPRKIVTDFNFLLMIALGLVYLDFSKRRKLEFIYRD